MPDYIKALVGDRRGIEVIDAEYSRVLKGPGIHRGFDPPVLGQIAMPGARLV
jgi:hypothetical protein